MFSRGCGINMTENSLWAAALRRARSRFSCDSSSLAEFEDDFDAPIVFYSRAVTAFGPVVFAWAERNSRI
jgi:hypothetical protein